MPLSGFGAGCVGLVFLCSAGRWRRPGDFYQPDINYTLFYCYCKGIITRLSAEDSAAVGGRAA